MTLTWTGSGGVFSVLGRIAAAVYNTNGRRGDTDPDVSAAWGASGPNIKCLGTEIVDIKSQHSAAQIKWYDGIETTRASMITAQKAYIDSLTRYAETFFINIVDADNPLPTKTLDAALRELRKQMIANSKTVNRCTVSATATAGASNVGDGVMIVSTTGKYGAPLEYAFAETLVATVTGDRNTGSTAGSEPISIVGAAKLTDRFDYLWPDGSGASATIRVIDPDVDQTAASNILDNSNFDTWTTPNIPDGWNILVGAAGTDVKKSVSPTYGSSSGALEFDCDGATLVSIAQTFGTGTSLTLSAATVYGFHWFISADSAPAAGVLKVDLIDATNTVLTDDEGTALATTVNLSTLTTAWVSFSGFFRTPTNMPTTVKIRISTPTAGTSGRKIYIDYGGLALATQLYTAGPYVACFAGDADMVVGDLFNIAVSNNRGGEFQTFFEQAFDMTSKALILPSSGSPNIADSLIL